MAINLPERNYLTFPELYDRWKCSENDIRELILEEQLKPSLFLGGLSGYFIDFKYDETIFGTRTIEKLRFEGGYGASSNPDLFYLREPWQTAALDCTFRFCSWSSDSQKMESCEPDTFGSAFKIEWCQLDSLISLDDVLGTGVVTNIEIARFEEKMKNGSEKPLSTSERKSLLTIIAALSKAANIEYEQRGASTKIAALTAQVCSGLDDETVRKALKAIPDALEVRLA